MKVYEALHNPMTEESSAHTISIHFSKEGAQAVIDASMEEVKSEHMEMRQRCISDGQPMECVNYSYSEDAWNRFHWWGIKETEILP